MKTMRRLLASFSFVVIPAAVALSLAQPGVAQSRPEKPASVALTWLDRGADACTDFYQFACGGWRAANPVPPDRQRWGQFAALEEENFTILRKILEGPVPAGDADRR